MAVLFFSLHFLALAAFTFSRPLDHDDSKRSALPSDWYHGDNHPVAKLFRRQNSTISAVGSDAWTAQYPVGLPETNIPPEWLQALSKAVADGKIPNITIPTIPNGNDPDYGADDPKSAAICSSYANCHAEGDIWDLPDGQLGLTFDDGPVTLADASPRLYDFIKQNNLRATHFMIGENILTAPAPFLTVFNDLQNHIAVHTWSHRHMSTLTNEQLVADLGWCMQIIHDSTGGRVPAYWRPPYGDSDNRVRAIAKEIFGLTTVIWNYDSDDWNIGQQGITLDSVKAGFDKVLSGPKSPGLNVLEHEISSDDVTAFLYAYPLMKSYNWTIKSIPEITGANWYQNAKDNVSPVTPMDKFADYPHLSNVTILSSSAAVESSTSESTETTAITTQPGQSFKSSSPPTAAPRCRSTVIFLFLTLGAYYL
jgi:peptidoglycan/xylan/chitin deacetylase (PgdA/CDA1 family)